MAPSVPSENGWVIIKVTIVLLVIQAIALVLRFVASRKVEARLGADSIWALLAYLVFCGNVATDYWSIFDGAVGYPPETATLPQVVVALKADYISTWLNLLNVLCVKLCVLSLYRRIFIQQSFQRFSIVFGIVIVCHMVAIILAGAFRCLPVESIWNPAIEPTTCIVYTTYFLAGLTINAVIDAALLLIPLVLIRRLQMPLQKKLEIGGIFLLGAGTVVASILRIVFAYSSDPVENNRVKLIIWSNIEPAVGLICACLIVLRPIIPIMSMKKFKHYFSHRHSSHSISGTTAGRPSASYDERKTSFDQQRIPNHLPKIPTSNSFNQIANYDYGVRTHVSSNGRSERTFREDNRDGVEVSHAVDVV